MAQLKDTVVTGNLQATSSLLSPTVQTTILRLPTTAGGAAYGAGTSGDLIFSNGSSAYWGTTKNIIKLGVIEEGTWQATTIGVEYGGTGHIANWNVKGILYASAAGTLTNTSAGGDGQVLIGKGSSTNPTWYSGLKLTGAGTAASPYDAQFAGKISFGSGNNIEDTIGDVYTPIYWGSGKPIITTPTQQINFSFNKDHKTTSTPIKLTHASIGPNTGVISIIVTSHIERLNGPITWELKSTSNNNVTTYYIELATTANIGSSENITIAGYIIISSMAPNITPNYIT